MKTLRKANDKLVLAENNSETEDFFENEEEESETSSTS